MPRRLWIILLSAWPGLAQIWSGQEVLGLILAVFFAVTLNLAIVAQFVWTEAFAPEWPPFFAALAALSWIASLAYTFWWIWRCHPAQHGDAIDRLFREATELYLQGKWNEARRRFEAILTLDETDADALMHLGAIFARTDQPALARQSFRQCLELEQGAKWHWEIGQALAKLGDR